MVYGSSDQFQPPPPQRLAEMQAARARADQAEKERIDTQQQRQQAPGNIQAGSPQDTAVRAEAAKLEQQRIVEENVHQVGSTKDQFQSQREQALRTGSFAVPTYAEKGVPASYVDSLGNRIERQQGGVTGSGSAPGSIGISSSQGSLIGRSSSGREGVVFISQSELQRTNAIRANAGLPKLESVTNVYVVKATQSTTTPTRVTVKQSVTPSTPKAKPEIDLRAELAALQGKAAKEVKPTEPGTEAVPFLSLTSPVKISTGAPIKTGTTYTRYGKTGQEAAPIISLRQTPEGTKEVKYTSILDALAFLPIGGYGLGGARSALRGAGSLSGKVTTSTGEIVIPKGVKPTEEKTIFDTISKVFERGQKTEEVLSKPSMESISLGRGIGKVVSTGGEKGTGGSFYKGGEIPPRGKGETAPFTRSELQEKLKEERTTQAGKGQVQVLKEREETKTSTKTEQIKDAIGKTESKTKTKAEEGTQDYLNRLKGKTKATTEEGQLIIPLVRPPESTQKERAGIIPILPSLKQTTVPPGTKPKEKQETVPILDVLIVIKQEKQGEGGAFPIGVTDTLQVSKQAVQPKQDVTPFQDALSITVTPTKTGDEGVGGGAFGGLGGGMPGLLEKVSKSGATKRYIGNVPEAELIGVYKRSEVSYSERTIGQSERETAKSSTGKFTSSKRVKLL